MTWSDIKQFFSKFTPAQTSGIIETTSGTPTELALYARLTNNKIAGQPHKFSWMLREYTLTLTGASSYDLKTLIPGFVRARVVTGSGLPNGIASYVSDVDLYRRTYGQHTFTIQNGVLKFDTPPTSGTLVIPYYTSYLVKASDGTYKQDFSTDTDVSVIPDQHIDLLLEGIETYFRRKESKSNYTKTYVLYDGRVVNIDPFSYLIMNAIQEDKPIDVALFDFRFEP